MFKDFTEKLKIPSILLLFEKDVFKGESEKSKIEVSSYKSIK